MRLGIKNKIFLFTAGLFVAVLALLMLFQSFVISDFFRRRQQTVIEEAVEELIYSAFDAQEPDKELYRLAGAFSLVHNTPFIVIDPEKSFFEQIHAPSNTLLVKTDQGQVYNLVVDGFRPEDLERFNDGQWIEFSGFEMDEQNLRAFFIETEDIALDLESTSQDGHLPFEEFERMMAEFSDRQVFSHHGEILLNNAQNMDTQNSQKLIGYHGEQIETFFMSYGIDTFFENDSLRSYDFEDAWTGTENRLLVRPVFFPQGRNYLLIAIISVTNTESVVAIFQEFYWVNFAIAIVISFIASYIYAGQFSKPIQTMDSIAKDMADLNFSRQIPIETRDEIGSLGSSLNLMSQALEEKIDALEDANDKLTDEILFKTEQEEIRKTFVANVSHELKTPITIMKGLLEGLKSGMYKDPDHINSALDEADRMERLVHDMLEISRYEAKGIELNPTVFSLDESVNRIFRRFNHLAEAKALTVTKEQEEGFIHADQDKIEQVLENLISNAIRYCPQAGQIHIKTELTPDTLRFSITNNGPSIPKDAMTSIWQPFYRVDTSGNRNKGGTGLGLVIVKTILEGHKADFGAENLTQGVCFWFELPLVVE